MFVQGYGRHANTGTGTVLVSCVSRLPPVSLNWYVVQVRCRVVVVFCERASPLRVCRVCLAATGCVCYRIERYAVLSRSIDLQLCHELCDTTVIVINFKLFELGVVGISWRCREVPLVGMGVSDLAESSRVRSELSRA